jgi:hypothetical protein
VGEFEKLLKDFPRDPALHRENKRDRKNINRGFKKLRLWQDAVCLYVMACKIFGNNVESFQSNPLSMYILWTWLAHP